MSQSKAIRPLEGVLILDLTQLVAGPFGSMLLADAGADVIKIERPGQGDPEREFGPFREDGEGRRVGGGYLRFGRNKRSLALDLAKPEGREVFLELVQRADVVWENFAPGVMERLGLGYSYLREVNPRIIYAAISGFGHTDIYQSPFLRKPAVDPIAQALSGLLDLNGPDVGLPHLVGGSSIGDVVPGLFCAFGVLQALLMRQITGRGQLVDIAMYDCLATLVERAAMVYSMTGKSPVRGAELVVAPYDVYRADDGMVVIATPTHRLWVNLCNAIGRTDLLDEPTLATPADRALVKETMLRPLLEEWLAGRTKAEAAEYFAERGVPAAPVQTIGEMMECPHMEARHMLIEMEHPVAGRLRMLGNPVKLSAAPEPDARSAPAVGEDSEDILCELLGYDESRVAALRAQGVLGNR